MVADATLLSYDPDEIEEEQRERERRNKVCVGGMREGMQGL